MPDNNKNNRLNATGAIRLFVLMSSGAQIGFAQVSSIGLAGTPTVTANTQHVTATNLAYAAPCAARPVYSGLFVRNSTQWEDHNRCVARTSANKDVKWRNSALCLFKYPLSVGKPLADVIFRVYNVDSSCRYQPTYKDYHPATNITADPTYDDVRADMVTMHNATSVSLIDRNGGTTYEYYILRGQDAGLKPGTLENALHANFGAALQTVLFGETLTATPCGIQGVWNPTQAGATCGTSRAGHIFVKPGTNGLNVICDALLDNNCAAASSTLAHTFHNVLNWDYSRAGGDGKYVGPYGARDTEWLAQTVAYTSPYYSEYDAFWRNTGPARDIIATTPVLYLNNHWRRISHPDQNGKIVTTTIPENMTGNDANNYTNMQTPNTCDLYDWQWMTADNTYFTTTGKSITLAWFRGPEYQADKLPPYTQSCIMESEVYRTIVFWNVPIWHQRTGVPYHFRWVIFPYRYDEVISYRGQSMTVQNAIKKMAVDFAANPALQRYHDRTSGAELITTFPASSNFSFVSTLGYLSRANVADTVLLYSCRNGLTDTFYRTDAAACLSFPVIRPEGYLYTRSAAGRLPLYSCFNALGHIATTRVDCEGRKMEGLLGWVSTHP